AFESNNDPAFKKNILLLGAFFWPNTDNAEIMEYKSKPANYPWMAGWTTTKMYETGHSIYPMDYSLSWTNVKNVWSGGKYAFVNWGGHGNPTGCYRYYSSGSFSDTSTCNYLNDNYPSIVFAAACSNSDTDYTNLGQSMLKQGAVGFLGATKVALGTMGWKTPANGSCQALDCYFTSCVTSGEYTQGQAHQWSLRNMYQKGQFSQGKYEMFEWGALWGNPNLTMSELPDIYLKFPEGLPEGNFPPGLATLIPVVIRNGMSDFLPGTAYMHYRFNPSDAYTAVPLTFLGGDEYEVTLPNTKPGDQPQFYFSAQCTAGQTIYYPSNAPAEVGSFDVYFEQEAWTDDFETDQGWTVENVDITHGAWERGDPEFTYTQPEDDHSTDGTQCFVTGRSAETSPWDSDVDGGPTRLISPVIDLSQQNASLRFYVWYYQSVFGIDQPLEIHLSNDNGASWVLVDTVDYYNTISWVPFSYSVADYLTPTSQVRIRFSACDNPDDGVIEALIDDFRVVQLLTNPSLWADAYHVSVASGAAVDFSLDAGAGCAGRPFLLLGSLSGTSPGFALPGGMVLPLNWDGFTNLIMTFIGTPVCSNFMGTLNASGQATATLNTYGPVDPALIGEVADFAYLLGSPFNFVSNSIPMTFEP
ncbi:MAG: C25 family cysteine peptidase, partial [Planctomycetota bacterium]